METGDFVAASVDAGAPRTLGITDVICGDVRRTASRRWAERALARFPGAQVAAAPAEESRRVVALRRPGAPVIVEVRGRIPVLLCAAVGYAWLVSGWPLAALRELRLAAEDGAAADTAGWHRLPGTGALVSYDLRYEAGGALAGPSVSISVSAGTLSAGTSSLASSRWTWSASGAPASSNRASAWPR